MTSSEQSDSPLLMKGTRRLHLASGDVWRVDSPPTVPPLGGGPRRMLVVRERDHCTRSIGEDNWLGDSWGRPRSRPGSRS